MSVGRDLLLFAGCLLTAAAAAFLVIRCRTALLGLNFLNLFTVASATLSAFFFGSVFGQLSDTFTDEHAYVVSYSIAGLLAMVGGIYLGWRPLAQAQWPLRGQALHAGLPRHLDDRTGLYTFIAGTAAGLGYPLVYGIPTVSTAFYCLAALARLGLFILLINALASRRWMTFLSAFAVFGAVSIVNSLETGHTFIRIDTLIPLIVIWYAFRGFTVTGLLGAGATIALLVPLVTAWLNTRSVIREGYLQGLPLMERIVAFFREYLFHLEYPEPSSVMDTILLRVDMTDILAEQAHHQPQYEPYAYGETLFSSAYTLIPRLLWADKPEVAGGSEFVARFTGLSRPIHDTTSVGLPYPFELYANGGPILVVAGLAAIGYIAARMELSLVMSPRRLGAFWALGLVTIVVCEGGQRADVVVPALVASALVAYALGWLVETFLWRQSPGSSYRPPAAGLKKL